MRKRAKDFVRGSGLQNELQHAVGSELRAALRGDEAGQLFGIDGGVLAELESDGIALALDGVDANAHAKQLERRVVEQVAHRGGGGP